jgi:hypothetical protein
MENETRELTKFEFDLVLLDKYLYLADCVLKEITNYSNDPLYKQVIKQQVLLANKHIDNAVGLLFKKFGDHVVIMDQFNARLHGIDEVAKCMFAVSPENKLKIINYCIKTYTNELNNTDADIDKIKALCKTARLNKANENRFIELFKEITQ